MDGVVADFDKAINSFCPDLRNAEKYPTQELRGKKVDEICFKNPRIFNHLVPIEGALKYVSLLDQKFDIYFLSTPMWLVPDSFTGKRIWLEMMFDKIAEKKLILTHRKDLCIGDFLVDDRFAHGVDKFKGEHIHFGSDKFPDWKTTYDYLESQYQPLNA